MYKIGDIYTKSLKRKTAEPVNIHRYLESLDRKRDKINRAGERKTARLLATVNKNRKIAKIVQRNLAMGNVVKVDY